MNKNNKRRHIPKNYQLRKELIDKGIITPVRLVPERLRKRGYLEAARVAAERLRHGLPLYRR